ncbi:DUF1842 domain-containing protein [Chromobacterium sp. CV08]|uniref:DUF1842 domain-containing protein n=1 Tax=Chromobacterium sp. CV08 TaxID=3133274 RepID=UPI003DA8C8F4
MSASSVGLFHTRLIVATPAIGAPVLHLDLVVQTPDKKVFGTARVFQATNPALQFSAHVWGDYSQPKLDKSTENHIALTLAGSPSSPISQIAETFHLQGLLNADWTQGFASYSYYDNGVWHKVQHATVSEDKRESASGSASALPPPHHQHPIPLYAAALQQARGGGNLAALKSLAGQAEAQLEQESKIRDGLSQLQAEIKRLEQQQG